MKYTLKLNIKFIVIFLLMLIVLSLASCTSKALQTPTIPTSDTPSITAMPLETPVNTEPVSITELVSIVKDVLTGLAIIIGGWWSYNKFIKNRQNYPRTKITHNITHISLSNKKNLLHVAINIHNTGNILLYIKSAETRIQQVLPLSKDIAKSINSGKDPVLEESRDVEWPCLNLRDSLPENGLEIEPGESDWLSYDFVIEKQIKFVRIYSYVKNVSKKGREIGWCLESFHDLQNTKLTQNKT